MPTWKESALFIEQQRLRARDRYQDFQRVLKEIAALFRALAKNEATITAFISYAHTLPGTQDEDWTKAAILSLGDDLKSAGITIILDEKNSAPGEDTRNFMIENVKKCDIAIVVGTQTLATKVTTTKADGSHYYAHFEAVEIIRKCLQSAWDPITLLNLNKDLADEASALSQELSQSCKNPTTLINSWLELQKKISGFKVKLQNAGIFVMNKPSPLLPIIISGRCETAMPFFTGEKTILECARNGTGDTLHVSYMQNFITILSSLFMKKFPRPEENSSELNEAIKQIIQKYQSLSPWINGLSEYQIGGYPSINAWPPNEELLINRDTVCREIMELEQRYQPGIQNLRESLARKHQRDAAVPLAFQRFTTPTNGEYIHQSIRIHPDQHNRSDPEQAALDLQELLTNHQTREPAPLRKILITGFAGAGKTTCTRRIASEVMQGHLWQERNFRWVFHIPLRALARKPYASLGDAILDLNFSDNERPPMLFWEILLKKREEVLLVADGLDEIQQQMSDPSICQLVTSVLNWPNLVLSGRPHSILPENIYVEKHYQLTGFNDQDIINYVTNYFAVLNIPGIGQALLQKFDNGSLSREVLRTPIVLGLACFVHANEQRAAQELITKTKLYQVCWEKMSIIYFKQYFPNEQPLTNQLMINRSNDILTLLGQLAHDDITSQYMLVFSGIKLTQKLGKRINILREAIKHGWLQVISSNEPPEDLLLDTYDYEFPHLTFAEFAAAHYWVSMLLTDKENTLANIQLELGNPRLEVVFQFMSGILADKHPGLLPEFLDVLLEKRSSPWGATFQGENQRTFNETKLYLTIPCLHESGVDHPWFKKNPILRFIEQTLRRQITERDDINQCAASDLFDVLSLNHRISLPINFNAIAIQQTKFLVNQTGIAAVVKSMNTIIGLSNARGLKHAELQEWLQLALAFLNREMTPAEVTTLLLPTAGSIIKKLSSRDSFEKFLAMLEGENTIRQVLLSDTQWEYKACFFGICTQQIHLLSNNQIDRILSLADRMMASDTKNLPGILRDNDSLFYTFFEAVLRTQSLQLASVQKKLQELANHTEWQPQYQLIKTLCHAPFHENHDDVYLDIIDRLSQSSDSSMSNWLSSLLEKQQSFAQRNQDAINEIMRKRETPRKQRQP